MTTLVACDLDERDRVVAILPEDDFARLPLCVDLDGTLIRSDMLHEGFFALAGDPRILSCLAALKTGRAAFKHRVGALAPMDPGVLPYNMQLLDFLHAQKAAGRYLVLATAAAASVAGEIARHLGIFDEVISSEKSINLKGAAKARALVARFGKGGFCYAGNSNSDVAIWREAAAAILVNSPAAILKKLPRALPIELQIDDRGASLKQLGRAMRPHQWVKNILVFVPILTSYALGDVSAWTHASLLFLAFCATASSIYLVNDLLDIAADRAHPRKRLRPFASGRVPLPVGAAAAIVLLVVGLTLGYAAGAPGIIIMYACLSTAYSFKLKELPLIDVFILAGLYTIRLFGGGEATGHALSLWLLAFSSFLFLSLALLKRTAEMMAIESRGGSKAVRRGYSGQDAQILQQLGIGAAFASSIVLALFVQSESVAHRYADPSLLWLIVPLTLFWQWRMWLAGARGQMHDDPIVYAVRDPVSRIVGMLTVSVMVLANTGVDLLGALHW
jgi:4-hydroxybenzoate polyprenyltransferase